MTYEYVANVEKQLRSIECLVARQKKIEITEVLGC